MTTTAKKTSSKPLSLWRSRDYLFLWGGQAVSTVGTSITDLAFPLLILSLSNSPVLVGIAGALGALPYVVFSLVAGALLDRWDRKRVMIICDAGRALALGSVLFALAIGHLTIIHILLVSFIVGTLFVFFNIAEAACLPQVVSREQLPAAAAQNQATFSVSFLLGPSLGGFLYGLGSVIPFLFDTISYVGSVISLLFIRTEFQLERAKPTQGNIWSEIGEGLVWLWRQPLIRTMAFLTGGINMFLAGQTLLIIVLAQRQHAPSFLIGLILAIGGIGAIVGSLLSPFLQKKLSFGQVIISTSWLFAILCFCYALAVFPILLGVIAAGFFLLGPIYNVVQYSYRLALIPDHLQGRVNSAFRLIAFGAQPLGVLATGLLLQFSGPITTVIIFGSVLALLALATLLNPAVRHARPLGELPRNEAPSQPAVEETVVQETDAQEMAAQKIASQGQENKETS